MNQLISVLLILCILVPLTASADTAVWVCPSCQVQRTTDFCPVCQIKRPQADPEVRLVEAGRNYVRIGWSGFDGAKSYLIFIGSADQGDWTLYDETAETAYFIRDLPSDSSFDVRILSNNDHEAILRGVSTKTASTPAPAVSPTPAPSAQPKQNSASMAKPNVGAIVTFGSYPQTAEGNDMTPIEWIVLDVQDGQALLLSRYGLDVKPFDTNGSTIWGSSSIRAWLNDDFMSKAFTAEQRAAILLTTVDNNNVTKGSPLWSKGGSDNTQDKVFLLNCAQVLRYFRTKGAHTCTLTDHALALGPYTDRLYAVDGKAATYWWLRDQGSRHNSVAYVKPDGSVDGTASPSIRRVAVRPAIWVDLEP